MTFHDVKGEDFFIEKMTKQQSTHSEHERSHEEPSRRKVSSVKKENKGKHQPRAALGSPDVAMGC
jgi:hypothetical protein